MFKNQDGGRDMSSEAYKYAYGDMKFKPGPQFHLGPDEFLENN